jgi:hypothetical protein
MLGGRSIVISGFSEVKAVPIALRISIPSPVPTTASFSAAAHGNAASIEPSVSAKSARFTMLSPGTTKRAYNKDVTDLD